VADNNWYVITGGPSSGKSTLIAELENLGYKTLPEAARVFIDEELAKGSTLEEIRNDERVFQHKVLRKKVELEEREDGSLLTFFDRGMHDTVAFLEAYGWKIEQEVKNAIAKAKYRNVFLLDPLPFFTDDYARTEDHDFTKKITDLLFDVYHSAGMTPIRVPVLEPKARTEFVLNHVNQSPEIPA
jgi:predicted ATPase